MNWEPAQIDLGNLRVNQLTHLTFKYIGDNPEVIEENKIEVSCGCTKVKWNISTKELNVDYIPNPVPFHLLSSGKSSYQSTKYITISLPEGKVDKLMFTAIVSK